MSRLETIYDIRYCALPTFSIIRQSLTSTIDAYGFYLCIDGHLCRPARKVDLISTPIEASTSILDHLTTRQSRVGRRTHKNVKRVPSVDLYTCYLLGSAARHVICEGRSLLQRHVWGELVGMLAGMKTDLSPFGICFLSGLLRKEPSHRVVYSSAASSADRSARR